MNATPPIAAAAPRRPDGIVILSIWYLVLAGGIGLIACVAAVPATLLTFSDEMSAGGRVIVTALLGFGVVLALLLAIGLAALAWGLWHLREWARLGALVMGALHLPFFPVGSAIGAATLWYLSSHPDAQRAFRR